MLIISKFHLQFYLLLAELNQAQFKYAFASKTHRNDINYNGTNYVIIMYYGCRFDSHRECSGNKAQKLK